MTAYSSAIKFTRLIPGNVYVQQEGSYGKAYVYFNIDPERMSKESYKKINLSHRIVSPYY